MTQLAMDPFTLGHTAISLIAIASGLWAALLMLQNRHCPRLIAGFLFFTGLTSITGFAFFSPPNSPTPAQLTGVVALIALAPTLYAFYGARLAGAWRSVYVVGAMLALYLNVFVLVVQLFQKLPSPFQPMEGAPPGGPVFGAVQGLVLIGFVIAGWRAVKRYHPVTA